MDTVKDFVLLLNLSIGVDWVHIYYSKKTEMILKIQAIYAANPQTLFFAYSSPRSGAKRALD